MDACQRWSWAGRRCRAGSSRRRPRLRETAVFHAQLFGERDRAGATRSHCLRSYLGARIASIRWAPWRVWDGGPMRSLVTGRRCGDRPIHWSERGRQVQRRPHVGPRSRDPPAMSTPSSIRIWAGSRRSFGSDQVNPAATTPFSDRTRCACGHSGQRVMCCPRGWAAVPTSCARVP